MSSKKSPAQHVKLGQWSATAICGNDILSSALYVSGIAVLYTGVFAPIVLLLIGGVLFLYKKVYTEVVEALPINGGAYNCLLNGTSKIVAAIAGVMTFLSYVATAVISAKTGVEYLNTVFPVPVIPLTIALLLAFAILVIAGIKDSAKVALGFFILHIVALTIFVGLGLVYFMNHGSAIFSHNLMTTWGIVGARGGLLPALYLGFSASLLGVSGFESSANFVEEQAPGVFRKTLRNMLIGVVVFNPLIALAVVNSMPIAAIGASKDFLLSEAAAVNNCLPNFMGKMNGKGSFPRIVLLFFGLCSSILIMTKGDLLSLAGVYTIAFLGVMSLFAFGNLILKETRSELKRTYRAPVLAVIAAFLLTMFGIFGNIRIDSQNLVFFELYFIPSLVIIMAIIYMDYILKFALRVTRRFPKIHDYIFNKFEDISDGRFIAFIHHSDRLYSLLNYIDRNEIGRNITMIVCRSHDTRDLKRNYNEVKDVMPALKKIGLFPHLNVTLKYLDVEFGPEVIDEVVKDYRIRKNRVMIGSIHHFHPYDYSALGGVRIIF
ncbi:APC family permease [Candidatus Microgenomates bacterium]|nr:APC family permease [Candidatus Microgenomates bacterium]